MAKTDGQIIAFAHHVAQAVVQIEVDPQFGILPCKGVDGGGDEPLAIGYRTGHAQKAARRMVVGLDSGQRLVPLVDQTPTTGKEFAPCIGQFNPSCRPV